MVRHGLVSVKGRSVPILGRLISIRGPLLGRRLVDVAYGRLRVASRGGTLALTSGSASRRVC